jgi:hypothetical protein
MGFEETNLQHQYQELLGTTRMRLVQLILTMNLLYISLHHVDFWLSCLSGFEKRLGSWISHPSIHGHKLLKNLKFCFQASNMRHRKMD